MADLFGIDIAGEIADQFSGQLLAGTLTKTTPGTRGVDSTSGTNPTTTVHTFEGFVENKTDKRREGQLSTGGGMFVTLLGGSILPSAEPEANDSVTIDGVTYEIVEIAERDPASAVFVARVSA